MLRKSFTTPIPSLLSQRRTVADLIGAPGLRLVAHRVTGEAHQRDHPPCRTAGLGQQGPREIGVEFGQRALGRLALATPFDHRPQPIAQVVRIGRGAPRAGGGDRDAVGLDQGRVGAVERGAAHHAKGPNRALYAGFAHE